MLQVPKVVGADIEFGNNWSGCYPRTNLDAALTVIRELPRLRPFSRLVRRSGLIQIAEQDRHWLRNGSCVYIDMSHLEGAVQETLSARSHTAAVHALYKIVRACLRRAVANAPADMDLTVNVHNSDGDDATSWGAHLNVLVCRQLWNALADCKPHYLALWTSFIAATVPVFGQGLLLRKRNGYRYVTSARAHHLGRLTGLATTQAYDRPLLNTRDEPHADESLARLHIIAYDANLQPAAIYLRTGLVQSFLAALEAGWFDARLILDDPLRALRAWSRSFKNGRLIPVACQRPGERPLTLVDWHRMLSDSLRGLSKEGRLCNALVPEHGNVLDLWEDTVNRLAVGDVDALARRLDWALKWIALSGLSEYTPKLDDPALRLVDQLYGHIDDNVGLFWKLAKAGYSEPIVDARSVRRLMFGGDPETRSSLRGELVRRLSPWIKRMDWGEFEFVGGRRMQLPPPQTSGRLVLEKLDELGRDDAALMDYLFRLSSPDLDQPFQHAKGGNGHDQ